LFCLFHLFSSLAEQDESTVIIRKIADFIRSIFTRRRTTPILYRKNERKKGETIHIHRFRGIWLADDEYRVNDDELRKNMEEYRRTKQRFFELPAKIDKV
jgi:hypothetical protein